MSRYFVFGPPSMEFAMDMTFGRLKTQLQICNKTAIQQSFIAGDTVIVPH